MRRLVALLPLLFVAAPTPAHALDTWMWGIGPHLGTMVLPGRYPVLLPRLRGEEGDTGPRGDEGIAKVQHDIIIGVEGVYYMDRHHRIGFTGSATPGIALGAPGRRFSDWNLILTYDYAIPGRALDVLFGGGIGAGTQGWRGEDDQRLRVNYFPLRSEVSALARDTSRGYQLSLFVQWNLPSNSVYTDATGATPDLTPGLYLTSGIEFAVLFGDFEPPSSDPSPVLRTPPPAEPPPPPPEGSGGNR